MSLTIQLPLTIEQHLRETAIKQGLSLENYVMQILALKSSSNEGKKRKKGLTENDLLMHTQMNILPDDLEEFYRLSKLYKSGELTVDEHEKLAYLNDLIEIAHAERMKYVVALAKLRNISLEVVMDDLGIKRHLG